MAESTVTGPVSSLSADTFAVETTAGPQLWNFVLPGDARLPLATGDEVTVRTRVGPDSNLRVEITAADGPRLGYLRERADTPRVMFGVSLRVEDVGCEANVIADCLLSRNAAVVVGEGGLANGGSTDLGALRLYVTAAVVDENACEPPEEHGPYLAAFDPPLKPCKVVAELANRRGRPERPRRTAFKAALTARTTRRAPCKRPKTASFAEFASSARTCKPSPPPCKPSAAPCRPRGLRVASIRGLALRSTAPRPSRPRSPAGRDAGAPLAPAPRR